LSFETPDREFVRKGMYDRSSPANLTTPASTPAYSVKLRAAWDS
jgi:hypothetical protein